MVKITRVEVFAGGDPLQVHTDTGREVVIGGNIDGGLGIHLSNGMVILVGDEVPGIIEVHLNDENGEQVPEGKMSWSDKYQFTVPA